MLGPQTAARPIVTTGSVETQAATPCIAVSQAGWLHLLLHLNNTPHMSVRSTTASALPNSLQLYSERCSSTHSTLMPMAALLQRLSLMACQKYQRPRNVTHSLKPCKQRQVCQSRLNMLPACQHYWQLQSQFLRQSISCKGYSMEALLLQATVSSKVVVVL